MSFYQVFRKFQTEFIESKIAEIFCLCFLSKISTKTQEKSKFYALTGLFLKEAISVDSIRNVFFVNRQVVFCSF